MKKLLIATCILFVFAPGCSDNSTKETSTSTESTDTKQNGSKEKQMKDSTDLLDKKLADPNSNYSPDSLK